jgi:hypothetical protein
MTDSSNQPDSAAPRTKREKFGSDNPLMAFAPSEFTGVPAGAGLDRTDSGKVAFGKGNMLQQIGHENKAKKRALFQKAIEEAVTLQDIADIATKLVSMAKAGDLESAKEVFNRTAGKVTDRVEVEAADGTGWSFTFTTVEAPPPVVVIDAPSHEERPPT